MSTSEIKPIIVIVGGAFHTPASYEKLSTALEAAGFEVHVPRLPTCNEARPPNADLTNDTQLVRGYMESLVLAGRAVVIVGHSYGGQVCSNALCGLGLAERTTNGRKGGVSLLVYMAGYALREGMSTSDKSREYSNMEDMPLVFDVAGDQTFVQRDPATSFGLSYPGAVEATDVEDYIKTLCRWHGKAMFQPLERVSWREIPVANIHTSEDISIPLVEQPSMVRDVEAATGRKVQKFTVVSGHCPNFNAAQSVADAIVGVVTARDI
ncbi:Uu.00g009220.m01.CDS01 [Anthostomella pinea]|uniref:Uu.00g009220.m01.CDS01 n=1 Tax=Anthostomella pinea TaxID=933095 RepID=A0AAI8VXC7_9PEZI|nr:Uu.00g009220.m01.CDS01 [Anthostomella pinea]